MPSALIDDHLTRPVAKRRINVLLSDNDVSDLDIKVFDEVGRSVASPTGVDDVPLVPFWDVGPTRPDQRLSR